MEIGVGVRRSHKISCPASTHRQNVLQQSGAGNGLKVAQAPAATTTRPWASAKTPIPGLGRPLARSIVSDPHPAGSHRPPRPVPAPPAVVGAPSVRCPRPAERPRSTPLSRLSALLPVAALVARQDGGERLAIVQGDEDPHDDAGGGGEAVLVLAAGEARGGGGQRLVCRGLEVLLPDRLFLRQPPCTPPIPLCTLLSPSSEGVIHRHQASQCPSLSTQTSPRSG